MKKFLFAITIMTIALTASAGTALAHQAIYFDPEPECMGKLTSFHAQDPDHGLRHSYENFETGWWYDGDGMPHVNIAIAMGMDPADNFQEFMKLNKAWCKSYKD